MRFGRCYYCSIVASRRRISPRTCAQAVLGPLVFLLTPYDVYKASMLSPLPCDVHSALLISPGANSSNSHPLKHYSAALVTITVLFNQNDVRVHALCHRHPPSRHVLALETRALTGFWGGSRRTSKT